MRVLVIGGTRFVGYQLVWRLLAGGHTVTLLNRGTLPDPFGARVERLIGDRTSEDFAHGFNLPDFGVRKDLVPGVAVEVTITPAKSGRFHYLCDNFCGEGHDKMSGILVVDD